MDNSVIFYWINPQWKDEEVYDNPIRKGKYIEPKTQEGLTLGPVCMPDYENDPGAWDSTLFDRIEAAGLEIKFAHELYNLTSAVYRIAGPFFWKGVFEIARSTPAQKSAALSRAIREVA